MDSSFRMRASRPMYATGNPSSVPGVFQPPDELLIARPVTFPILAEAASGSGPLTIAVRLAASEACTLFGGWRTAAPRTCLPGR